MILNIAAYRFVPIEDPQALAIAMKARCKSLALKGTILLAREGINLFIAGTAPQVREFITDALRADDRFTAIEIKESFSPEIPFKRMKVKLKKEIVTFRQAGIDPARDPAPALSAAEFRAWLDAGKDMIVLDTRNTVEFERGAFAGSQHLGNDNFTDFAAAMQKAPPEWKDKTVVTFCTGGIRCEKAAPYLSSIGYKNVLQLQGGILKYFEEIGQAHYHGDCFVFDEREALDAGLAATKTVSQKALP